MRKLFLLFISLLVVGSLESRAQVNTVAQVYEMTPIFGHASMVENAILEHVKYRKEHGDPWNWDIFQVITGPNMNSFYARSGNHTWADLDAYNEFGSSGAIEHFNSTVLPHLSGMTSFVTQGIPELIHFGNPEDLNLYQVVFYDVIPSKQFQFVESVGKFMEVLNEAAPDLYAAFAMVMAGGDGSNMMGVFPKTNWAGFEDPGVEGMLFEALGAEGAQQLFKDFSESIRSERSIVLLHRKDLSSMWVE